MLFFLDVSYTLCSPSGHHHTLKLFMLPSFGSTPLDDQSNLRFRLREGGEDPAVPAPRTSWRPVCEGSKSQRVADGRMEWRARESERFARARCSDSSSSAPTAAPTAPPCEVPPVRRLPVDLRRPQPKQTRPHPPPAFRDSWIFSLKPLCLIFTRRQVQQQRPNDLRRKEN